jgi:hypothetical protein
MFLQITNITTSITILGLILGIIIAGIILIVIALKSKRNIEGSVKHGKTEASIKVTSNNNLKEIKNEQPGSNPVQTESKFDLEKLTLHRFFTTILVQYTADSSIFNLYNETVRLGIIKDSEEIAQFKKLIASKYLNLCLFKVLGEHIKAWINNLVKEVNESNNPPDKVPNNFFAISQHITQYKNDAYKEGKSIEFKYSNKTFYGIPTKFMHRFNNWSDSNMTRVYNMISDALYSTQDNWFAKTIELLDLFEVIFIMLHDQMDATLIILNGEIANFIKRLKEDPDTL